MFLRNTYHLEHILDLIIRFAFKYSEIGKNIDKGSFINLIIDFNNLVSKASDCQTEIDSKLKELSKHQIYYSSLILAR